MKALEALDELYGQALEFHGLGTTDNYNIISEALQSMQWRPIDDKAKDGNWYTFALQVRHFGSSDLRWERYVLQMDEDGQLRDGNDDYFGDWSFEDFTHYIQLPAPPQEEV